MSLFKGRSKALLVGVPAVVLVLALVFGFFFCPFGRQPIDDTEVERATLRLAWIPQGTFAGDYVALRSQLWEQRQLYVDVRPGGFQFDAIRLVATGEDTFGIASGPELLLARARGVPVVALGVVIPDNPVGWVSHESSGITEPRHFLGRRVGAQYGTHTEITLEAMMGRLRLPLSALTRVGMQFDYSPFVAGRVDVAPVYMIDQPVSFRRQGIHVNIIDPRRHGINLGPGNVYFTSERVIRERPDVVRNFLAGAAEGWRQARANPLAAAIAIAPAAPGTDVNHIAAQVEAVFQFIGPTRPYPGVFPPSAEYFAQTVRYFRESGVIDRRVDLDGLFGYRGASDGE